MAQTPATPASAFKKVSLLRSAPITIPEPANQNGPPRTGM